MKFIKTINLYSIGGENNPAIYELTEEERNKVGLNENKKYLTCFYAFIGDLNAYSQNNEPIINYIARIKENIENSVFRSDYEGIHETIKECEYFIIMNYYRKKLIDIRHDINTVVYDIGVLLK